MDGNKPKEGISVKEIHAFTKKYPLELFFCIAFILACIFAIIFWGLFWSIITATIGAVIGILMVEKTKQFSNSVFSFVFKQEMTVQLVLGVVGLILAIFVPPLYFFILGLHGGKDIQDRAVEIYKQIRPK